MNPSVSVLVPTYNRHQLLVETLKGLLIQQYAGLEIVVYDQSTDHPAPVKEFLAKHSPAIRVERGKAQGLVNAYRACLALSSGAICVFVDDDVLITDEHFISRHAAHYQTPEIGAVMGQVRHENQPALRAIDPRMNRRDGWRYVRFDIAEDVLDLPTLSGQNMSFRREAYEKAGGFDNRYRAHGFWFETDFSFALKKAGYRIRFDPKISLIHRYGSPGGAENGLLRSLSPAAHGWYLDFFSNTWYFLLKWHSFSRAALLLYQIWREHVFNRAIIRQGLLFLCRRQRAFCHGSARGWKTWQSRIKDEEWLPTLQS